jgi:hypothetical protein
MNANPKAQLITRESSRPASAEQRLKELGIKLPAPPEPFGTYVEAVQTGNLLFLSGMLPAEGHSAKFVGPESRFHIHASPELPPNDAAAAEIRINSGPTGFSAPATQARTPAVI